MNASSAYKAENELLMLNFIQEEKMHNRQKQTLFLLAAIILSASFLFSEEEFKPYQSLLPPGSTSPAGYLIVQVPESRKAPGGWEMDWFVSAYTPKGYRIPLGTIEDTATPGSGSKLAFKVPVGQLSIEITRKSEQWTSGRVGAYLVDEGRYQCEVPESVFVAKVTVPIQKDEVKIVNLNYQNPQVFEDKKEKDRKVSIFTWQNLSLSVATGSPDNLPKVQPETHHLVKSGDLQGIDNARLVQALKEDSFFVAAVALLHTKKPPVDLILAALNDKSLNFSGPVALILAKARDKSAAPALIGILQNGPEDMRHLAAWTLGELGAGEAVEPLVQALKANPLMLRNNAAFALAKIKDPRAVEGLTEAAKSKACLEGMSFVLARPEMYLTYYLDKEYKNIGVQFPIPSNCLQGNALYALGQIRDEKALNALLSFLNGSDPAAQQLAIFPLSNFKDDRVAEALLPKLKSSEEATRWMAVHALSRLRADKAAAALSELAAGDPSSMVKEAAAEALKKIKETQQPKPAPKKK